MNPFSRARLVAVTVLAAVSFRIAQRRKARASKPSPSQARRPAGRRRSAPRRRAVSAGPPDAVRKDATDLTRAELAAALASLPVEDGADFADARRGLVAPLDAAPVLADGRPAWDLARFAAFQAEDAPCPPTVHPGLWRQARLNAIGGLFRVADGVYQVRGMDLSNMTLIEGATGRIVVDPLISGECASAALDLAARHLGERPVSVLIYTHSHADHFGGSEAVRARAGASFEIVAPEGFLEHAISENVLAGNVMRRRAGYMYGALLPADERGCVDAGLGKTTSSGRVGLVPPTRTIAADGSVTLDGVEFVFQLAPETEAPSAMMFHLPAHRVFNAADTAVASLHNLYTPRGAEVRDAISWSRALDTCARRFAAGSDVLIAGHSWPRFGSAAIETYLFAQRDVYKFIHDQSLRLANAGLTPREIAAQLRLPASLGKFWFLRDYYGTISHNSKAVYQRYLGWFDAHPANLDPLPPKESAPKYVAFMGGARALLARAREAFAEGEYRFVAEVLTHLVFAEPENDEARYLQADALEQLGYRAESAPWRNFYLTGAQELRDPSPAPPRASAGDAQASSALVPAERIFDALAVSFDGVMADGLTLRIAWNFSDGGGRYFMSVDRGVLNYWPDLDEPADVTVTTSRDVLGQLLSKEKQFLDLVSSGALAVEGALPQFVRLLLLFERPDPNFRIVTP